MKKIVLRGAYGAPLGVAIGYLITIVISLGWGGGVYSPCVPELISVTGSEIGAVILQTLLCALLGTGFGACSVIWELEHWSVVTQTGVYFLIVSIIMLPVAWFTYWMEHSVKGFLSYSGIFILIFLVMWVIMFLIGKHNVEKLNAGLSKAKEDKSEAA